MWLQGNFADSKKSLRAWPPAPPNANGGRAAMPGAGCQTGSGPAQLASASHFMAGNGTRVNLGGHGLTPWPSTPLPHNTTPFLPAPSPPLLPLPIIRLPYLAVHTKVGAHPFVGNSPRSFPWTHGGLWRGILHRPLPNTFLSVYFKGIVLYFWNKFQGLCRRSVSMRKSSFRGWKNSTPRCRPRELGWRDQCLI
jgi:hypothetical protein